MQSNAFFFQSSKNDSTVTDVSLFQFQAKAAVWDAAFNILYPIEFLCVSLVKVMVLDRMVDFALAPTKGSEQSLLQRSKPAFLVVLLAVAISGSLANIASAIYRAQSASINSAIAAAGANQTVTVISNLVQEAAWKEQQVQLSDGVQQFCEVFVLLLIIVAFTASAVLSSRRISSSLKQMTLIESESAAPAVRTLRRQIVGTAVFVFVTFVFRAVFAIMFALSNSLDRTSSSPACAEHFCDESCKNEMALLQTWITFTPEFRLIFILVSSPLCLLVALWGMTSSRARESMRGSFKMRLHAHRDSLQIESQLA